MTGYRNNCKMERVGYGCFNVIFKTAPNKLNRESIGFVIQGSLGKSSDEALYLREICSRTLSLMVIWFDVSSQLSKKTG